MKTIVCLLVAVTLAHLALATDSKLRVVTIHDPPYVFVKTEANETKVEGFVVDLLNLITNELNLTYEVVNVTQEYGRKVQDSGASKWTGLIGELEAKRADIAAAAFTRNAERAEAASLTHSFLKMKLQLLLHRDLADKIKHIKDLAHANDDIAYGALEKGNTWQLLTKTPTTDTNLTEVAKNLIGLKSLEEGVEKARDGKFVVILEGHTANYWAAQPPCILTTTEGELHEVEYVFAVAKEKASLRDQINSQLDDKDTQAKIEQLKVKYWPKEKCTDAANSARPALAVISLLVSLVAMVLYAQ